MNQQPINKDSSSGSKIKKCIRWVFISIVMATILYTIGMAIMKKFGG